MKESIPDTDTFPGHFVRQFISNTGAFMDIGRTVKGSMLILMHFNVTDRIVKESIANIVQRSIYHILPCTQDNF